MRVAFLHRILFGVLLMFCGELGSAYANSTDGATVLQSVLREHYPNVEQWIVTPTHMVRSKQASQLFAQPTTELAVYRNGNLFVVHSTTSGTNYYVVKANTRMLIANMFSRKGSELEQVNTGFEFRDAFATRCDSITDDLLNQDPKIWRLRRDVHTNEAICRNDIEPVPLVSKHEAITLLCTRGAVMVAAQARAMSDGELGTMIKVRRQGSHVVMMARVTGRGEVNACI